MLPVFFSMYVCLCFPTTEQDIRQAARQGACTLRDLHPVATRCGKCGRCAHQLLQQNQPETGTASVNTAL